MYSRRILNIHREQEQLQVRHLDIQNIYNTDDRNDYISLYNHNGRLVIKDNNVNGDGDRVVITEKEHNELLTKIEVLEKKIEELKQMILYMPPGGNQGYQEAKDHFEKLKDERGKGD